MNKKTKITFIVFLVLAIGLNLFILINAFIPGEESKLVASPIVKLCAAICNFFNHGCVPDPIPDDFIILVRKLVGHFSCFLVDGVLTTMVVYLGFKGKLKNIFLTLISVGYGIALAGLTEIIQLFIPGRAGSIVDVFYDSMGYIVGAFLLYLAYSLVITRKKEKENSQKE